MLLSKSLHSTISMSRQSRLRKPCSSSFPACFDLTSRTRPVRNHISYCLTSSYSSLVNDSRLSFHQIIRLRNGTKCDDSTSPASSTLVIATQVPLSSNLSDILGIDTLWSVLPNPTSRVTKGTASSIDPLTAFRISRLAITSLQEVYQFWLSYPEFRQTDSWSEPEDLKMKSQMTPLTPREEDLELKSGHNSLEGRVWEAVIPNFNRSSTVTDMHQGFDARLFSRSLRLHQSQETVFMPYMLRGNQSTYRAYHEPFHTWVRRKSAADTFHGKEF